MEDHWSFVLKHERELRNLCAVMCRGRNDVIDELYSDCVIGRAPNIWATYDTNHESCTTMRTHMFTNMKFYMWKWMNCMGRRYSERNDTSLSSTYDIPGNNQDITLILDLKDRVEVILDRISEYDADILYMYHWEGLTFKEMAERLGVLSKGTARNRYIEAMKAARDALES